MSVHLRSSSPLQPQNDTRLKRMGKAIKAGFQAIGERIGKLRNAISKLEIGRKSKFTATATPSPSPKTSKAFLEIFNHPASSSYGSPDGTNSPVNEKINQALAKKGVQMPLGPNLKTTAESYRAKLEKLQKEPSEDGEPYDKTLCQELLNEFQGQLGSHPLSQEIKNIIISIHDKSLSESFEEIFACIDRALEQEKAKDAEILKNQAKVNTVAVPAMQEEPKTEPQPPVSPLKPLYDAYQTLVQLKLKLNTSESNRAVMQVKKEAVDALKGLQGFEKASALLMEATTDEDLVEYIDDIITRRMEPKLLEAAPSTSETSDPKHIEHMAKELGLEGREIDAFTALVKAPNSEKKVRMEMLLRINPEIKGSVRITFKDGEPRVRVIVTKTQKKAQLGEEGGYKACYKAIRIGGKFAERMKMVVTYETSTMASKTEFLNDAKQSVEISKELQEALEPDEKGLFIQYKLYDAEGTNRITAGFANGGNLQSKASKLTNTELKAATQRLLRAGHAMERNGFSHNDLKFDNVFIHDGEVVIGDLGLMDRNSTRSKVVGTYGYIPPDLLDGKTNAEGTRHDNFSLGVMLLCMYTGAGFVEDFDPPPKTARKKIAIVQKVLKNFQPETPIARVISGLISAEAEDRMTFQEALTILADNSEAPLPDKNKLNSALDKALSYA